MSSSRKRRWNRLTSTLVRLALPALLTLTGSSCVHAAPGLRITRDQGQRYVRLSTLADHYGLELKNSWNGDALLSSQWSRFMVKHDSRITELNGVKAWLHQGPKKIGRHWCLTEADALTVVNPVLRSHESLQGLGYSRIVIDPGHGGKDSGTRGTYAVEKKLVLDISRRVRRLLQSAGFEVLMTREGDRFIELTDRAAFAARQNGDLFVSIHVNSAGNKSAQGFESFIRPAPGYFSSSSARPGEPEPGPYRLRSHDGASMTLAHFIHREVIERISMPDRGLKRADFAVLREAVVPAVLIECGFVSNPEEEHKLISNRYREELAVAIATGIRHYVNAVVKAQLLQ